jgi:hypothetical protein
MARIPAVVGIRPEAFDRLTPRRRKVPPRKRRKLWLLRLGAEQRLKRAFDSRDLIQEAR